jgi:hypothetical protein
MVSRIRGRCLIACEDLPRLVRLTAGIEHVVDLGAVLAPIEDTGEWDAGVKGGRRHAAGYALPLGSRGLVGSSAERAEHFLVRQIGRLPSFE